MDIGTVHVLHVSCVYVWFSVQKLVDNNIERKSSVFHSWSHKSLWYFISYSFMSRVDARLVVILLIIFNFFLQGEKPPGLYDPNRPAYSKDVCFLYSDSDAHESKSMSHSKNPDNKTINSIRGFLEDKNIRCSIARPPIDSHGEFRFEISIMWCYR